MNMFISYVRFCFGQRVCGLGANLRVFRFLLVRATKTARNQANVASSLSSTTTATETPETIPPALVSLSKVTAVVAERLFCLGDQPSPFRVPPLALNFVVPWVFLTQLAVTNTSYPYPSDRSE